MADWNTPSLTTGYSAFLTALKDRDVDIATLFNNGTPTNTPPNAIKLDAANNVSTLRKWNGTSWVDAITTFYAPSFATTGQSFLGDITWTGNGVTTGSTGFEIGGQRTGSGLAYIDFHAVAATDYEARVLRNGGANGAMDIRNTGTGNLNIVQEGNAPTVFFVNGSEKARLDATGLAIGVVGGINALHVKSSNGYITIDTSSTTNRRTAIAFRQNGTQIWDVGTDIGASNQQSFYIFDNIAGTLPFTIDSSGASLLSCTGDNSLRSSRGTGSQYCYHDFWTGGGRRGWIGADTSNSLQVYGDSQLTLASGGTLFTNGTGNHVFQISGAEKARLTGTGLGIGTSSPAYPLDVNGAIRTQSGGIIFPDATTQTTAAVSGVGSGQTFQSPARTYNTSYQNTTGKPIMVMGRFDNGASGANFQVSNDNSTWFTTTDGSNFGQFSAVIPNGAYYRISAVAATTIYSWVELR